MKVTEIEENAKINKDMLKKEIESSSIKLFDVIRKELKKLEIIIDDVNARFNLHKTKISEKINGMESDLKNNISRIMEQNMQINDSFTETVTKIKKENTVI